MSRHTARQREREPAIGFPTHYSGPRSLPFWNVVNGLSGLDLEAAYEMGCILQDVESRVLTFLIEAQNRKSKRAIRASAKESK